MEMEVIVLQAEFICSTCNFYTELLLELGLIALRVSNVFQLLRHFDCVTFQPVPIVDLAL